MVGKNDLRAIGDEKIAVHFDARSTQRCDLFQKSQRIDDHAIADHARALRPQYSPRNQLQNKFLAIDDDGMSGIVSAGVARHHRKSPREYIDNLPLALVAPLRADDDRGPAPVAVTSAQPELQAERSYSYSQRSYFDDCPFLIAPGIAHTECAATAR